MNYRPLPSWYTHGHYFLYLEQQYQDMERHRAEIEETIRALAEQARIQATPDTDQCGWDLRPYRTTVKDTPPCLTVSTPTPTKANTFSIRLRG